MMFLTSDHQQMCSKAVVYLANQCPGFTVIVDLGKGLRAEMLSE